MTTTTYRMLPLYEGKMIHHFDHRWASVSPNGESDASTREDHEDARFAVYPRYWVAEAVVEDARRGQEAGWLLGFRDVTNTTNERTFICSGLPPIAAGHKLPMLNGLCPSRRAVLQAIVSSFVFDFVARQKIGGTSTAFFILEQLPVPPPAQMRAPVSWLAGSVEEFVVRRMEELTYTAWDMQNLAGDLGDDEPPFCWDDERRAVLRAELDALCFHLYGLEARDDVDYILGTFPIVHRKDLAIHGEERTRRLGDC